MHSFLQKILYTLARLTVQKYQPQIIGITGTVGKTSAKEAIQKVLPGDLNVRASIKNYNNEYGVALTILGYASPGKNIIIWVWILIASVLRLLWQDRSYPQVLVVEMGADHPGDIAYLTSMAPCYVGVITAITPVHMEFYKNLNAVYKEKKTMVSHLSKEGWAVLNGDDVMLQKATEDTKAQCMTYGLSDEHTLSAQEVKFFTEQRDNGVVVRGLQGKFNYRGTVVPFHMPGVLAYHHVYAALAAACVGIIFDQNLVTIAERLQSFRSPKGRMNLLQGYKQSWIIDDSYNSSPEAVLAALAVLHDFPKSPSARSIMVLGDMNELGTMAKQAHTDIGKAVADIGGTLLITFGQFAKHIAMSAVACGMDKEHVRHCNTHEEIIEFLRSYLRPGDITLVKGSQTGIRLEKVVKGIMAHPENAKSLLVRQDSSWK